MTSRACRVSRNKWSCVTPSSKIFSERETTTNGCSGYPHHHVHHLHHQREIPTQRLLRSPFSSVLLLFVLGSFLFGLSSCRASSVSVIWCDIRKLFFSEKRLGQSKIIHRKKLSIRSSFCPSSTHLLLFEKGATKCRFPVLTVGLTLSPVGSWHLFEVYDKPSLARV